MVEDLSKNPFEDVVFVCVPFSEEPDEHIGLEMVTNENKFIGTVEFERTEYLLSDGSNIQGWDTIINITNRFTERGMATKLLQVGVDYIRDFKSIKGPVFINPIGQMRFTHFVQTNSSRIIESVIKYNGQDKNIYVYY